MRFGFGIMALVLLLGLSGCSSSQNSNVMPEMSRNTVKNVEQYKTWLAKKITLEKKTTLDGLIRYGTSANLFFRNNGGYLKAVYVKEGEMVEKGEMLAELDTADLENKLAQKRIELAKAKLKYDQRKLESKIDSGGLKLDMEEDLINMDSINIEIGRINREISEARLYSPISGIAESVDNVQPGDYVQVYKTFVKISRTDNPIIETSPINPVSKELFVLYTNPSGIVAGMDASIEYTVYKNKVSEDKMLTGTVLQVKESVADAGLDTEETDISQFPPLIAVVKPNEALPGDLRIGDSVSVILDTGKLEDIIAVPTSALIGIRDDKSVKLLKDGKVIVRPVTTGYEDEDADLIEITKGICEGETVIIEQ